MRPPKSDVAVMPQSTAPLQLDQHTMTTRSVGSTYQQNTILARNFPVGSLTRKYATTGCQISCATYTIAPSQLYSSLTRFVCSIRPKTAA